jgi:hypothetical protein
LFEKRKKEFYIERYLTGLTLEGRFQGSSVAYELIKAVNAP